MLCVTYCVLCWGVTLFIFLRINIQTLQMKIQEKILFWRIQKKDKEAFAKAYDLYVDQIYRFVYFKISNTEEAHDLTSQVFLKAWEYTQKKGELEVKTVKALLYRISRNCVIDYYRKNNKKIDLPLETKDGEKIEVEDESQDILKNLEIKLDTEEIKKKLLELKEEYREVIILHFIDELSVKEIADILNKDKGNVRVLIHRAIKSLKKLLV